MLFCTLVMVQLGLLIGQSALAQYPCDPTKGPCYDTNDDILLQRWLINPVDDLVVANPSYLSGNVQMRYTPFWTSGNNVHSQQPTTIIPQASLNPAYEYPLPQQTRLARLFDQKADDVITVGYSKDSYLYVFRGGKPFFGFNTQDVKNLQLAVADVTGDGYDDLIVMNDTMIWVLTAVNVENSAAGLRYVAFTRMCDGTGTCPGQQPTSQPVVADFTGLGIPTLAWVGGYQGGGELAGGDEYIYFATICVQNINGGNYTPYCNSAGTGIRMQPSSTIYVGQYPHGGDYCAGETGLAAGRFWNTLNLSGLLEEPAKLFLIRAWTPEYYGDIPACTVNLRSYYMDTNFKPIRAGFADYGSWRTAGTAQVFAVSNHLYWFGELDQAVVAVSGYHDDCNSFGDCHLNGGRRWVGVVTFDINGNITLTPSDSIGDERSQNQIYGLAVGRFNDDPLEASNYDPTIAVLEGAEPDGNYEPRITFLDVEDPVNGNYTPVDQRSYYINTGSANYKNYGDLASVAGSNMLQMGDTQGRSFRLGPPIIGRIYDNLQARAIAGIPPMMVDLVGDKVVNFSAVPTSFSSQFNTSNKDTKQSSTESTTSSTTSVGAATEAKVGYVWPASNVEASLTYKGSVDKTQNATITNNYNTYETVGFDVSAVTNTNDVVWWTYNDYNLYYYPVIGLTQCPEDTPNCTPAEQQQSYVEVSGPSNNTDGFDIGYASWYQPVQEPFQIFSYPRTQDQLQASLGEGLTPLTSIKRFSTSNESSGTYSSTWANQKTDTSTVATSSEIKMNNSVSAFVGVQDWKKTVGTGASISVTASYGTSTSNKDINLESTSVGQSSGLTGTLPGTFLGLYYSYPFWPIIYGQPPRPNEEQEAVEGVNINTHGILYGAFLADATDKNYGTYWTSNESPYNQPGKIDIALNHPFRWVFNSYSSVSSSPECLRISTKAAASQCAYEVKPNSVSDVWADNYYLMRGLSATVDAPYGPQADQTTEGRTVFLQARVYNYSLQKMPDGSELHVRFYRQQWNFDSDIGPVGPVKPAVLLNPGPQEIVTSNGKPVLIPPYGAVAPNWVTAQTSFDTSGLANQHFVFWVVAWAQKDGKLVPEVDNHGLASIPGTLSYITDAPLQWVDLIYPSDQDNRYSGMTSFTNNVGFLRQDFYVAPATSPTLTTSDSPAPLSPRLLIGNSKVLQEGRHKRTFPIIVDIGSADAAARGLLVICRDVTKSQAVPCGSDLIPNINVGEDYQAELPYTADSCGRKQIEIVVEPGRLLETMRNLSFRVPCPL
jgi:hypothetical protein